MSRISTAALAILASLAIANEARADDDPAPVVSESWWKGDRPSVDLHGYFRTRGEIFYDISLGRYEDRSGGTPDPVQLFPHPLDDGKVSCGDDGKAACSNKTHATANMRLRLDPDLAVSANLHVYSQLDLLDNLVLGSTPNGFSNAPSATGGYTSTGQTRFVPLNTLDTQTPPTAGINGYRNSIDVKRVWGEYSTPIGTLRFGRMPAAWGLGILENAGDRIDSDWQSTIDRIMLIAPLPRWGLFIAAAWDFPGVSRTSSYGTAASSQGQPYSVASMGDVSEWMLSIWRRVKPSEAREKTSRGEVVINGGIHALYRQQLLANESSTASISAAPETFQSTTTATNTAGLVRVGAKIFTPDLWVQVLTKHTRWESELVYVYGAIENPLGVVNGTYQKDDYKLRQLGLANEFEYRTTGEDFAFTFYSGLATGDAGVDSLNPPASGGLQPRHPGDKTISTFRFHPDYRVDLVLWRNILSRVQGAYYFKPGVEYDFEHTEKGEKIGARFDVIWSRASKPSQTPGQSADLGVEFDLTLFFQAKDGSLNDDRSKLGGFYMMGQYGFFYPLGGLGYRPGQTLPDANDPSGKARVTLDIASAQIVRLFLGIAY